tara:strand:- start:10144 stop:11688 length:1545 start_codon:yes stop_codon:yes gene_type:complete
VIKMDEEEFGLYDEEDSDEDPQWRGLSPGERKTLLKTVFSNNDWYEDGALPVFEGGSANPLFDVIAERVGAPVREIKRYYAAWLSKQGFSADQINKSVTQSQSTQQNNMADYMIKDEPAQPNNVSSFGGQTPMATSMNPSNDFMPMPQNASANSDAMGMWAMMNFLTSQQRMAMQQQQFQMMQNMEQRKLDQNREEGQRREAMARDQQFMNQQMAFMREMMKKSGDDGFFDSEMKNIMKEKVVDQMLGGGGGDDWKGMVKDVLGSDTLKAAVGGIGGAIGKRSSTPAGYNVAGYNPYAQPEVAQPQQYVEPGVGDIPTVNPQTVPEPQQLDGVFFDEPQQEIPREPTSQEYQAALLDAMGQMLGPSMNDPATLNALKEQIEVSVETVLTEMPGTLPNHKLLRMTEKLLLILNMRDIGLGLKDLRSKTDIGQEPSALVMAVVVEELRKKPEFYKIFAENTYEELLAIIEPFKNTGTIQYDFDYLLKPEVAEICRYLLAAVQLNAQQNGLPAMPTA